MKDLGFRIVQDNSEVWMDPLEHIAALAVQGIIVQATILSSLLEQLIVRSTCASILPGDFLSMLKLQLLEMLQNTY